MESKFIKSEDQYNGWFYDQRTAHSRLCVGLNKFGIKVRQWDEGHEEDDEPFRFAEAEFSWNKVREGKKNTGFYSWEPGERQKELLVRAAIALLSNYGTSSDDEGSVPDLDTGINCGRHFSA